MPESLRLPRLCASPSTSLTHMLLCDSRGNTVHYIVNSTRDAVSHVEMSTGVYSCVYERDCVLGGWTSGSVCVTCEYMQMVLVPQCVDEA